MLKLFEELFMISLRSDQAVQNSPINANLRYGIVGSILAELVLQNKIQINQDRRLAVLDTSSAGDEILDKTVQDLQDIDHPRKVTYWIQFLNNRPKKLQKRLTNRLIAAGVFVQEDDTVRWAVPSKIYPDLNATAKYAVKNRLRNMVLDGGEADLRSVAMASLAQGSGLLKYLFTRDERREAGRRIQEILVAEALKNPAAQALEEIHRALDSLNSK